MPTIQQADLKGKIIRSHMAKMIANYATKVLGLKPDTTRDCTFDDVANVSPELQ